MTFGFKSRDVAERLKRMAGPVSPHAGNGGEWIASRGLVLVTPSGGIPAATGSTAGKASCQVFYIDDDDDEIVAFKDEADANVYVDVYNVMDDAVGGSKRIVALDCLGLLVCVLELCDNDA